MEAMTGVWKEVDDFVKMRNIPIHMMLEVSRRCNINCVHCYNIKDRAHLRLDQIEDIFKQLREAGCLFLTLTGGEVFARPDAVEILYKAREYGFDLRMITNGTMITKDKAKALKEVSMMEVGVSILGGTAKTHDVLTRVPGSFGRTLQGIKNCQEAKVPVHIKCTLMNENVHEYRQVIKLAKDLGVVYMIDPIVSPRDDGDKKNLKHRLTDQYLEEFYMEQFQSMEVEEGMEGEKEKGLPCEAGTGFGAISADGNIYPCIQMPMVIGNILEDGFSDIWRNSSDLEKLRNVKNDEFNNCTSCQGACSRCPGLAYLETGDPFGPSSIACYIGGLYQKFEAQANSEIVDHAKPCCTGCTCH